MPNRYKRAPRIRNGKLYGTYNAGRIIYRAVQTGDLDTTIYVTREGDRLDIVSGDVYGTGDYWWVIAAASGIGWGLQVPPGTQLVIPTDIQSVEALVG